MWSLIASLGRDVSRGVAHIHKNLRNLQVLRCQNKFIFHDIINFTMVSLETMPAQALMMMQTIAFLTSGFNINHRNLNSALEMEISSERVELPTIFFLGFAGGGVGVGVVVLDSFAWT